MISYGKRESTTGILHITNGQRDGFIDMQSQNKHVILWIYIDIYMNSMLVSPTLEQTLHLYHLTVKVTTELKKLLE
jgi:hypothetical protein